MTEQRPEELSPADLALLKHVREHSTAAPSAAMDALILKAAAAAVVPPSLQQRFLAGKSSPRWGWSLGFASVATIGLGLSLSLRTLEQPEALYDQAMPAPTQYSAPQPEEPMSAPAPALKKSSPAAPAAAPAKAKALTPSQANAERQAVQPRAEAARKSTAVQPSELLAEDLAAPALQADGQAQSADYAASVPPALTLQQALQQILRLRSQGAATEAQVQLTALKQHYPAVDIDQQLQQLEALQRSTEAGTPAP